MEWFTADLHLGHENIIKYANRPFSCADDMDEELIYRWNELVRPTDVVYCLGDFTLKSRKHFNAYVERLSGTINFIPGGHDLWIGGVVPKTDRYTIFPPILSLEYPREDDYPQVIVLCHYAMRVWDRSHYGSWHLYGHSHGKLPKLPFSVDVGVDAQNFYPVSLDDLKEYFGAHW